MSLVTMESVLKHQPGAIGLLLPVLNSTLDGKANQVGTFAFASLPATSSQLLP